MSEKMYPIPFKSLMNWIVTEYAREGEIFGVHTPYYATGKTLRCALLRGQDRPEDGRRRAGPLRAASVHSGR